MKTHSYVDGFTASAHDAALFAAVKEPPASFPHARRWYRHIGSFSDDKRAALPGTAPPLKGAPTTAPAAEGGKGEGGKGEGKKKEKKEKAPKEAKKEEKKGPTEEEEKAAAAAKLRAKVIKEGGKKGVEIEGASDMGGLDFFCTTIEMPDGDVELLQLAMTAMNANPEEGAEDRKGCSGHVGKMVFSAGVSQLAIVAYVPADKAEKVDCQAWAETVVAAVAGSITKPAAAAESPHGGLTVMAVVAADPDKGKFPLKDKDAAMAAAFAFLREKGAFPEDNDDDDDDEMVFGDDAFEDMGFA